MNKLLVDVRVPIIQKTFEMLIPPDLSVFRAKQLIIKLTSEQVFTQIGEPHTMLLCNEEGTPLPDSITVYQSGIRDGDTMLLI